MGRCVADCVAGAWDLNRLPADGCERGCGAPVDGQLVSLGPLARKPGGTRIAADADGQTWGTAWVDVGPGNPRVTTRLVRAGFARNFDFALVGRSCTQVEIERVPGAFILVAGWLDPNGRVEASAGFDVFALDDGSDVPSVHALKTGAYNAFDAGVMYDARTRRARVLIAIDDTVPVGFNPRLNFEALTFDLAAGAFGELRSGAIEVPLTERRVSMPPAVVAVQEDWLILSRSTILAGQVGALTADLLGGADSIDGARAIFPESIVSFGREFSAAVDDDQRVILVARRADGLGFESMRLDASNGALRWLDEQSFVVEGAPVSGLALSTSAGGFVLGYAVDEGGGDSLRGAILSAEGITVAGGGLTVVSPPPGPIGGLHLTYGGGLLWASWWQRRANPDEGFDIRAAILDCE